MPQAYYLFWAGVLLIGLGLGAGLLLVALLSLRRLGRIVILLGDPGKGA